MRTLLIALVLLPGLVMAQAKSKPKDKDALSAEEMGVLEATNAERVKAGLKPLKAAPKLMDAARGHSNNMAAQSKLDHVLDGKSPGDRVKATGYLFATCGENVGWNSPTPAETVKMWMNSPGHKANILNKDYTEIGIAVARNSKGEPYWTQVFGRPR